MDTPEGLIFDVDGTLLQSEQDMQPPMVDLINERRGLNLTVDQVTALWSGKDNDTILRETGELLNVDLPYDEFNPLWIERVIDGMKKKPPAPLPDALKTLERLAPVYNLSAASSNQLPVVEAMMRLSGCAQYIPRRCIMAYDHLDRIGGERAKPAPDIFHHAARAMGIELKKTWVVGDTMSDAKAAQAAGVPFVGIIFSARDKMTMEINMRSTQPRAIIGHYRHFPL